ncbi:uncharacterized protein [Triticum aestivum]|uniref:uncharacterized protein isoform X4 n=1 Tax=Triticum aestivum TaxID=4565 RepID=UPI0003D42BB0|nr:uncharacterized protein LOC123079668 isoform X4 [Triticum aestivum]XP_044448927.1 uncharacterized protein LOC123180834 isoform X5 [Triticum aestivum]
MQLHCETTGDLVQALVHVRCSDVVIEGAGANGQSVSPKGGGPCNMKKTIQTKGRYTDSQGCKETCSDGDLPECCFPPREVPRILEGVNKTRRRLTKCRLTRFGCINELI